MKELITTYLLLISGAFALGAQPQLPVDYKFECIADYQANESLAKACITWLVETPMDQNEVERSQLTAFALKWLTGHPVIRIEFRSNRMPFASELPDMMVIFMLGAAREHLMDEQAGNESALTTDLAGLKAVLRQAEMTESLADDEALREWFEMESRGELTDWLQQQ